MENKTEMTQKALELITSLKTDVQGMKTKGDQNEADLKDAQKKLDNVKELVDNVVGSHADMSDDVKALKAALTDTEKSIADLDLRTKGRSNYGTVSMSDFSKAHKEMKSELAMCKNTGKAVTMKLKRSDIGLPTGGRTKASNLTESANYLGSFVIAPDRLPGFFAPPLRPTHIREFINQSETESNIINWNLETEYADGSGSTAQGSAAGQSDFTLTAQQTILQKINQYYTVSKEMIEDTPVTENYIRTRGVGRLLMFEDTALLFGNGVAPNQNGIIPVASAYAGNYIPPSTPTGDPGPPNYYDVLLAAVTQAKVSYYRPNIVIVHPQDYTTIIASKDYYGRYQFMQNIEAASIGGFYIGGALLVENTAITQGTFLVGDFNLGATMFTRDEIEITFSNQNVDNFIKGFITIMVEERIANVVYRPTAFVTGTFAAAIASGS